MLDGDEPLSGEDISRFFNNEIKVLKYGDIKNYKNVEELLEPFGRLAILYPWKKNEGGGLFGHWVGVFINSSGNIEYFNSFGSFLEEGALKNIDRDFKKKHNEDFKYLTNLFIKSPYTIEYNPKALQNKNTNTCGRWVVYRLLRDDLSINQFNKLFKKNTLLNDKNILKIIY